MAFVYDPKNEFENYVNSNSVIWQMPETRFLEKLFKNLIKEHQKETQSVIAKNILEILIMS